MTVAFAPGFPPPAGTSTEKKRLPVCMCRDRTLVTPSVRIMVKGDSPSDALVGRTSIEELRVVCCGDITTRETVPLLGAGLVDRQRSAATETTQAGEICRGTKGGATSVEEARLGERLACGDAT
mmetsp:Transcript_51478/g.102267  ORF Transcript_51478/g.102267 Transcript_51478/m.102267 type:complete len:124 (-) Transcript_51478:1430-1801(-)